MIAFCCPAPLTLSFDDGIARNLPDHTPEQRPDGNLVFDPNRVCLSVEEQYHGILRACRQHQLPEPLRFSEGLFRSLPQTPRPLTELLAAGPVAGGRVSVCLFNGGGGGLGDGIMFAPALRVLAARLTSLGYSQIELDVYSMLPRRTQVVLAGCPRVRVEPLPLLLGRFMEYDGLVDFSGMLQDEQFQRQHLTDFALARMGIDPESVPAGDKAPRLVLGPAPAGVAQALARARQQAGGRKLVALIFSSSHTRSLPVELAVELLRKVAVVHQPVVIMPPEEPSAPFLARHGLAGLVCDLSPASSGFAEYMTLLAGMDGIVSVDTSAVHIGGALGIPTVALFNSIDHRLRVRYSPSVHPIQLAFQGKTCQAPCGASKARAFVQGDLANGRPVRLEFGYACDEAVDKDSLLEEVIASLKRLDFSRELDGQLQAVRRQALERFTAQPAPCWRTLDPEQVLTALAGVLAGG